MRTAVGDVVLRTEKYKEQEPAREALRAPANGKKSKVKDARNLQEKLSQLLMYGCEPSVLRYKLIKKRKLIT